MRFGHWMIMNSKRIHATPKVLTASILVGDTNPKLHSTVKKVIPENDSLARKSLSDIRPSMLEKTVYDENIFWKLPLFTSCVANFEGRAPLNDLLGYTISE